VPDAAAASSLLIIFVDASVELGPLVH
jgi:hypothetical protein